MIVVDVETTGPNPNKNSIVSIGALDFLNPTDQFYQECRIWEGAEIRYEALERNGFTREQITDSSKPSLEQTIKDFTSWSSGCKVKVFAGHNIGGFDIKFIEASLNMYKIDNPFQYRTNDLHSECYNNWLKNGLIPFNEGGKSILQTDTILNYVGLPSEPKPHNALTGAKLEAEAFSRLIYGKNLLEEFAKYEIPKLLK